jgi:hypothetical protein
VNAAGGSHFIDMIFDARPCLLSKNAERSWSGDNRHMQMPPTEAAYRFAGGLFCRRGFSPSSHSSFSAMAFNAVARAAWVIFWLVDFARRLWRN